MTRAPRLTLYAKPGCHLCEDLRALLADLQPEYGYTIDDVDITRDAALFERYRYEIPVLVWGEQELVRGRTTEVELIGRLREVAGSQ